MTKLIFRLMAAIAVVPTAAFAAEDKTVAYGETLDITEDTTYLNLVVNGTLNVAEGRKLTCETFVLGDGATRPNAKGGNEDDCVVVPEFSFDDATPPMCFIHGDGDVWSAMNSVKVWERLRGMGIRCDLHTLAKRGHSFQVNASLGTGSYSFMDRLKEFLSARGLDR